MASRVCAPPATTYIAKLKCGGDKWTFAPKSWPWRCSLAMASRRSGNYISSPVTRTGTAITAPQPWYWRLLTRRRTPGTGRQSPRADDLIGSFYSFVSSNSRSAASAMSSQASADTSSPAQQSARSRRTSTAQAPCRLTNWRAACATSSRFSITAEHQNQHDRSSDWRRKHG